MNELDEIFAQLQGWLAQYESGQINLARFKMKMELALVKAYNVGRDEIRSKEGK